MPRKHQNFSISMTPELYKRARARAESLGFGNSFSAYVTKLIRDDLERTGIQYSSHRNEDITSKERPKK